ncbi:hypothetical protein [Pectobacterium polaris]|uniref:hypothetical protein n=1 Tax=Pectobacterium polaris TaxID=2042057 RepID=UPI0021C7F052|nr:hypothetical protein [Pectobacterium polaris]MCU1795030.1 hypothetical protein [Pectobacterium polaris]
MITKTYSLLIAFYKLPGKNRQKYAADALRRINMDLRSDGFAANKGFKDEIMCSPGGFLWRFDNKEQRDRAIKLLREHPASCSLLFIKTKSRKSVSSKSKYHYVKHPRLSPALEIKWQSMLSQSSFNGLIH